MRKDQDWPLACKKKKPCLFSAGLSDGEVENIRSQTVLSSGVLPTELIATGEKKTMFETTIELIVTGDKKIKH